MNRTAVNGKIWGNSAKGAVLPVAILALVLFMMVPVPAILLDEARMAQPTRCANRGDRVRQGGAATFSGGRHLRRV